ncbi:MAG: aldo/keto reductase [Chloroflexota bacterium]
MAFDPTERVVVGRRGVRITRLGFGTAEIGGLYRPVSDDAAVAVVDAAWAHGIRYFDTAPLYGYGNGERRLGVALAGRRRDEFVVSSKVGRVLVPRDDIPPGADIDRQIRDGVEDGGYKGTPPVRVVFDYSADGVMRSVEASLERLGLDRLDILYIHDPDDHWEAAIRGATPALHRLRDEGVVGAIGAGMNQWPMLARFAREGDFDVFLLASRYTLLDQSALAELLPLCVERGISIVAGGVMNTGLLADPRPGALFDYGTAPLEMVERAQRLRAVCDRHGVSLKDAAIQFPLAHPAVAAVVTGVRSIEHLDDYPRAYAAAIPAALWDELRAEGLIGADAPVPSPDAETAA